MADRHPLSGIQREHLEPIWERKEISTARIASRLGVSRQALSSHAKKLGLASRRGNQVANKIGPDDLFKRMWMAGVSTREMAHALGYKSHISISTRARRLGLPYRVDPGQTPGAYRAPITLAEFREVELARLMRGAVDA